MKKENKNEKKNKFINIINRYKNSNFIGSQLSRFKLAMSYYAIIMSTISAVMLIKTAYPVFQIEIIILLLPLPVLLTLFIGYILDKKNISTMDTIKSNEMAHRFIMTSDKKAQEFQMIQTKMLLKALQCVKEGTDINLKELDETYLGYVDKWKSPY